eukprot:855778-Alexandrium_andersonii.AAC.1
MPVPRPGGEQGAVAVGRPGQTSLTGCPGGAANARVWLARPGSRGSGAIEPLHSARHEPVAPVALALPRPGAHVRASA